MMRFVPTAALAFVLAHSATPAARAETLLDLQNDMVEIEYVEPEAAKYKSIYQKVQDRKILERFSAFLAPLKLKSSLRMVFEEGDPKNCKYANSYYDGNGALHLCYSWFWMLENEASKEYPRKANEPFTTKTLGRMPGVTREEVILGGSIHVMLHELGHALFDIQEIPLFGREEDAADQLAALLMLQFGNKVALTTIKGAYNTWHHLNAESKGEVRPSREADVHSLSIQRSYNTLCMAYGKDPETFGELAERLLPRIRRANCPFEYQQAARAFTKTFMPDMDQKLAEKVRSMEVVTETDYKQ